MAQINEAEYFIKKIQSHEHFNDECLPKNIISKFPEQLNKINKIKKDFDELQNYKDEIIKTELDKKIAEKELNNLKIIDAKELDNIKLKLNDLEEIYYKENENNLNNLKDKYNNFELKNKNTLEILGKEIENLKKEIKIKEESFNNELDLKKKEELFKIANEFKLKLIQYTNKKKLEKQERETEMEIRQRKFEADRAIELNELNQKALLVQKIISSIKNISLK